MIDLERAGADLVNETAVSTTPVAELRRRAARRTTRGRVVGTGAVLVTAAMVTVAMITWPSRGTQEVISRPASASVMPLPTPGSVQPEFLRDGTPVFVVRHRDGDVSVVSAISAHRPAGIGYLVGWCSSSRWFEDPVHGSQYDEFGVKTVGPAPSGLVTYAATIDSRGSVRVGSARTPAASSPQVSGSGDTPGVEASGRHCAGPNDPGTNLVLPPIDADEARTPAQVARLDDADYHLVTGVFVIADGNLAACPLPEPAPESTVTTCSAPVALRGIEHEGGTLDASVLETMPGTRFVALARPAAGALTDVIWVDGWNTGR
jgi:Rieske Fe-S protein